MERGEVSMKRVRVVIVLLTLSFIVIFFLISFGIKAPVKTQPLKRSKITVSVYDRGWVPAAEGTIEKNRWTKWINENGPVDVEFIAIPRTDAAQKINTLFASGSAPDLIFEYNPSIKKSLYDQKQFMPIDDLIRKYSVDYKKMLEQYPVLKKAGTMSDGKMYQFGRITSVLPLRGVVIRADWLKKLKLESPKTADDYYKVAKAFTVMDPDGNGKKDTYGIVLSSQAGGTVNQMFQSNPPYASGSVWVVKNNKLSYGWEQIRARLTFEKKLYDEGIVDKEYLLDRNGAKAIQDFVNGKVGILPWLFTWRDFATKEYATLKKNVPEAELAVIPYPETQFGRFNPTFSNPVQMTAVVNARCKNPAAVMKYIDFTCSKKFGLALTYGIEGVHYKMVNGKPVILDPEKFKKEVSWTTDYRMMSGSAIMGEYLSDTDNFDLSDPIQKEGYELYKKALKLYLNPKNPYPELTHSEHVPQLPKELAVIEANINLTDFYHKAIIGGVSYSVEQAMKDAQAAWERGGGKQIEDWMKNWYRNEKNKAFLAKDIYDMMIKENKLSKLK
jgi:putative aldouronate transport system substrate-binding protein